MLTFEPITPQSAPRMRPYYADCSYHLCEYSVGVKLMWGEYLYPSFTEAAGCLIIRNELHGETLFDFPVPGEDGDVDAALTAIEDYCTQKGIAPVISVVPEQEAGRLALRYPRVHIVNERAWKDYLYRAEDLSTFAGRRYSGQRNHINKFRKQFPDARFVPLTMADNALIERFWGDYESEFHKDSASAQAEEGCVREFLRDFAAYAPLAGLLRVNGRVAGFSAGEIVGDTLIIHIEKADIAYEGVYQVLVNEYAKCFVTPGVRYINREEDAGDEGLRRSKESYHPVRLLEKYLVQIPAQPEKGDKSMQEVYEFLKKCGTYYLATVDGDQPHVRPFGTVNLFEGNLYIQTGKVKAVSREMTANPKVELCAFDGETWLRVSAKAVEDDRVQARQDLLDHYPELQSLYTADDGNTQVFALTEATATFSSFQAAPRVVRW